MQPSLLCIGYMILPLSFYKSLFTQSPPFHPFLFPTTCLWGNLGSDPRTRTVRLCWRGAVCWVHGHRCAWASSLPCCLPPALSVRLPAHVGDISSSVARGHMEPRPRGSPLAVLGCPYPRPQCQEHPGTHLHWTSTVCVCMCVCVHAHAHVCGIRASTWALMAW